VSERRQDIDGLMLVDLAQTPQRTLEKYMGSEQAQAFLAQHGVATL